MPFPSFAELAPGRRRCASVRKGRGRRVVSGLQNRLRDHAGRRVLTWKTKARTAAVAMAFKWPS